MLEDLLPGWRASSSSSVFLGFAATDFIITITLSAADATAHLHRKPLRPEICAHRVGLTLGLYHVLGAFFLKGFREVIGLAVFLVTGLLVLECHRGAGRAT